MEAIITHYQPADNKKSSVESRISELKAELGTSKVGNVPDEGDMVLQKFLVEIKCKDKV